MVVNVSMRSLIYLTGVHVVPTMYVDPHRTITHAT
jgi:hypothetical protein